ncbi:MAG: hypothetical protein COB04_14580 [Gammaproteobacteria bacterium]|nr:MAG: hypothetical protein COB04_14580 [Gammaproteobacteria bacterium]
MTNVAKIVFVFALMSASISIQANTEQSSPGSLTLKTAQLANPATENESDNSLTQEVKRSAQKAASLSRYRNLLKANMNKQLMRKVTQD